MKPFQPIYGSGKTVSAAAASASTSISSGELQVAITNTGLNIAYVRFGVDTETATTADMPILSGSQVIVTKSENENTLAYMSALGTTLYVIEGEGN